MPREIPILNLGQVADLVGGPPDTPHGLFHAFGIFKKETQLGVGSGFCLFDEYKEIEIRPVGELSEYPRPRPGDIVRIHRLRVNTQLKSAEIPMARNVLVWSGFQHDPVPKTVARNPTIRDHDLTRRRILEAYFCTRISKLGDLANTRLYELYDAVAGRIEAITTDTYGHLELQITDGTGSMTLRVFKSVPDRYFEDDTHFKLASELRVGELVVATAVKLAPNKRLNLSANLTQGRSLSRVDESSILGIKLAESLASNEPPQSQSQTTNVSQSEGQNPPRRSPRFQQQHQQQQQQQQQTQNPAELMSQVETPVGADPDHQSSQLVPVVNTFNNNNNNNNNTTTQRPISQLPISQLPIVKLPPFTLYSDIKRRDTGFEFYDLVGQVRDKPRITPNYGNCVLQIFDGSLNEHPNYYASEVEHPLEGCLIVCVYSKQKMSDTDEHFDKASAAKEGDLLYLTNVKVSFWASRIRVELNANKLHNKSINVIDPQSPFGMKILNLASTPQVAELRDLINQSSTRFPESDDEEYF